jgi:hypothetical protein
MLDQPWVATVERVISSAETTALATARPVGCASGRRCRGQAKVHCFTVDVVAREVVHSWMPIDMIGGDRS